MMIWQATSKSGQVYSGSCKDKSWATFAQQRTESVSGDPIVQVTIVLDGNIATIDNNADGYFIIKKASKKFYDPNTYNVIGLGYYRSADGKVRIKWYNMNTLMLNSVEVRDVSKCHLGLLING
jgi:hypothetical protein